MEEYLSPTFFLDFTNEKVQLFCSDIKQKASPKEKAVALYYKVRDGFVYDPYHLDIRPEALTASKIVEKRRAWCVEKAILYVACCRYLRIPARLGFGIVVNHLGAEQLKTYLKREEIVFHGYAAVYLDGEWIKTTPAFDKIACRASKVSTLEWDGTKDAMLQAYEGDQQFMQYIHFYGEFADLPITLLRAEMQKYYPHLFETIHQEKVFSFTF
ncbi:MAG: transglutaminase family protein [Crocinitomicaceae bacterium]|nr:transglutaminase family protein [Crocinitomicaceae bacterium]